MREIVVDNFAGGGGASTGIEAALGGPIDVAVNHDPNAIAMHKVNHPQTKHLCQSVWRADPRDVAGGSPVGLAWFSPDCKHFSKAKGGTPVKKNIRDLAWVVVHWAKQVRPRIIMLENVEEFRDWGPLIEGEDGTLKPCPLRKGFTYRRWKRELQKEGYKVEERELRACDYGAPTSRKRLFVIARCDGQPIVWPEPTHGPGRDLPWRVAADILDWSIPCPSIFERKKSLAENTLRRIAAGVMRHVINRADPFIVPVTHVGDARVHGIDEPLRTITTAPRGEHALVTPYITKFRKGSPGKDVMSPLPTITANSFIKRPAGAPTMGLVAPTLIQMGYGEREGQAPRVLDTGKPLGTVVAGGGKHGLVAATLAVNTSGSPGSSPTDPLKTITTGNHHIEVAAFMAQHNTDNVGHDSRVPVSTIVGKGCTQAVVTSSLINLKGKDRRDAPTDGPVPTITAGGWHVGEVRAFLLTYFGTDQDPQIRDPLHTITTKHRHGIVTVHGQEYQIVDLGMRMLQPRELFDAQGFPHDYIIDHDGQGNAFTKTVQIEKCGNSVCPPIPEALVRANYRQASVATPRRTRVAATGTLL